MGGQRKKPQRVILTGKRKKTQCTRLQKDVKNGLECKREEKEKEVRGARFERERVVTEKKEGGKRCKYGVV